MKSTQIDYIDIAPTDPRHRKLIGAAIKANDTYALELLRGNTDKPIRFVCQAFMYLLMASSWEKDHDEGLVVIFGPEGRETLFKLASPDLADDDAALITIPSDTYAFLL